MQLENAVAIVTGSGSGIGRGIARHFAREGASLVVADVDPVRGEATVALIHGEGGEALFVPTDVTSSADIQRMVAAAVQRFGRLDVLVNNAGISPVGSVTETSEEEWDRCLAVGLKSVFLGCKYAIPAMVPNGGGAIVNIAGTLGLRGAPRKASYCAAKAGVVNLTRQMALDYGRSSVRVNCICPGFVDTPLTRSLPEPERQRAVGQLPIPRAATVDDVASAAVFLASSAAAYITGAVIVVDGGQTLSIPA